MSLIDGGATYPAAKFPAVGSKVAGRIISYDEAQATEFGTRAPKFFPDGKPIMQAVIGLETVPGDETSRVTLYAEQGKRLLKSIQSAVAEAGGVAPSGHIGADLSVTKTGTETAKNGAQAFTFSSVYVRADADE